MNKIFAIICVILMVIIFSISLIRIVQSFFTIYFYYDYVVWCGKEEKQEIKNELGVNSNFSIACSQLTFRCENQSVTLMSGFPSIFSKEVISEKGIYSVSEYIKEKDNKFVAMLMCCLPYIVVSVGIYIVYYKKVLPILTGE